MKRTQRGDTLVEVMLATAVIGLVIGSSYATATKALRTGRFAQEQTEALKIAESEVEKLKYIASLGTSATASQNIFPSAPAPFCIDDTFQVQPITNLSACAGLNGLYSQQISYTAVSIGATDTFTVAVTWTQQGSGNQGNVQIAYRLHSK